MNLKRIVVFALLLIAAAAVHAQHIDPKCNVNYKCHYTNYTGPIVQDGLSTFVNCPGFNSATTLIHMTEKFQSKFNGQVIWDNRSVVFAKPVDFKEPIQPPGSIGPKVQVVVYTQWEFTVGPSGPQCKNTLVSKDDGSITYDDCTDGSSRTCYPQP